MDDQRKLSPSEERAEDLAAQARRLALQITRSAEQLVETIDTAGAAEAQTIAHLADRLFGAIARRDLARHKAKAERPITFVGPPVRWCDAYVIGTGAAEGRAVGCNRMLRPDGTCPHAAQHVNGVAHRHIERGGVGPLCTAPARADGSCTAYPKPEPMGTDVHRNRDGVIEVTTAPVMAQCERFHPDGAGGCVRCGDPIEAHPQDRV